MVGLNSAHSAYCMSDCSGLRWSEQIKALQKLWCPLLICKAIWLPCTSAGKAPAWFCWLVAVSGFADRRHVYIWLMALGAQLHGSKFCPALILFGCF